MKSFYQVDFVAEILFLSCTRKIDITGSESFLNYYRGCKYICQALKWYEHKIAGIVGYVYVYVHLGVQNLCIPNLYYPKPGHKHQHTQKSKQRTVYSLPLFTCCHGHLARLGRNRLSPSLSRSPEVTDGFKLIVLDSAMQTDNFSLTCNDVWKLRWTSINRNCLDTRTWPPTLKTMILMWALFFRCCCPQGSNLLCAALSGHLTRKLPSWHF